MSESVVSPAETPPSPAGKGEIEPQLSLEKHQKLLDEKKKLQKELDEFRNAAKKREEEELKAKEDYKKIAEIREKEAKEAKAELDLLKEREKSAVKLDAFLKNLDGHVPRKYWGHINLDDVVIDPESGEIEKTSVAMAVDKFKKEYFEIIQKPGAQAVPNSAPQGAPSTAISYEDWKKLPAREMKARLKDVIKTST